MSTPTPEAQRRKDDSDSDQELSDGSRRADYDTDASADGPPPAIRRSASGVVAGATANLRSTKHLRFSSMSMATAPGALSVTLKEEETNVFYPGGDKHSTLRKGHYITEPHTPNILET